MAPSEPEMNYVTMTYKDGTFPRPENPLGKNLGKPSENLYIKSQIELKMTAADSREDLIKSGESGKYRTRNLLPRWKNILIYQFLIPTMDDMDRDQTRCEVRS